MKIALLLICSLCLPLTYGATKKPAMPQEPTAQEVALKAREKLVNDAQIAIMNRLKDPESARFRNIFISPNQVAVCGEVNAKNSMGGYVGFRRFIVSQGKAGIADDETYFVEARWQERCVIGTTEDDNTAH